MPSMKKKIIFGLGAIALMLIISGVISIFEYRRMSDYMSDLIATNVDGVNNAQKLYDMTQKYHNQMLAAVMRNDINRIPDFDQKAFVTQVETLREAVTSQDVIPVLNSLSGSFADYTKSSLQFDEVFLADSVDTEEWFFGYLQPKYNKLSSDIGVLSGAIHSELRRNASDFDAGFYRSIIPGVVSVGAGLMLVFLLMYYIIIYYVNPIYRMSNGVNDYRSFGKRYTYEFEGDDQLADINTGITEVIEENIELKKRLKHLREERDHLLDSINRTDE